MALIEIDGLPIENGGSFHGKLLVITRGYIPMIPIYSNIFQYIPSNDSNDSNDGKIFQYLPIYFPIYIFPIYFPIYVPIYLKISSNIFQYFPIYSPPLVHDSSDLPSGFPAWLVVQLIPATNTAVASVASVDSVGASPLRSRDVGARRCSPWRFTKGNVVQPGSVISNI